MKRNDITNLHTLDIADLLKQERDLSEKLAQARLDKHVGKLKHRREVSVMARDLARLKTIITEKSLG